MKKYILLAVFALVALASAQGQTNEQDSTQMALEAEQQAYKDSATATPTGIAGQIAYDSSHIYICVATNTCKRVAISTW